MAANRVSTTDKIKLLNIKINNTHFNKHKIGKWTILIIYYKTYLIWMNAKEKSLGFSRQLCQLTYCISDLHMPHYKLIICCFLLMTTYEADLDT